MNDDDKVRILGAVAINACNAYIDRTFRNKEYDDYSAEEKLRSLQDNF